MYVLYHLQICRHESRDLDRLSLKLFFCCCCISCCCCCCCCCCLTVLSFHCHHDQFSNNTKLVRSDRVWMTGTLVSFYSTTSCPWLLHQISTFCLVLHTVPLFYQVDPKFDCIHLYTYSELLNDSKSHTHNRIIFWYNGDNVITKKWLI